MIREHAFNTRWWGAPVGVVDIEAFQAAQTADRTRSLQDWTWVECTASGPTPALREILAAAGFVHADTTIQFRLDLRRVPSAVGSSNVTIRRGSDIPTLDLAAARPFQHERFYLLREATPERVMARYTRWGAELHRSTPDTVLQFEREGRPAGWFLSQPGARGLDLALAMTAVGGGVSGATLYREACRHYAQDGHRFGEAGFSVRNLDVLNVYAALGARFVGVRECWLWQPVAR